MDIDPRNAGELRDWDGEHGAYWAEHVQADAQLFFSDPAMAFANLARAARPGGRLVMFVWRGIEDNEWLREFMGAIGRVLAMGPPPAGAPGPFALSDPGRVRDLLEGGGWTEVAFAAHDAPLWCAAGVGGMGRHRAPVVMIERDLMLRTHGPETVSWASGISPSRRWQHP